MKAVLDANVFIHGKGNFGFGEIYTIQEVLDEVKSQKGRNVLENTSYSVLSPSNEYVEKVGGLADEINSPTSEADEKLVALALEKDFCLVTDDKPVQNLALHLGVDYQGFLDSGTDEKFEWEKVCERCGADFSGSTCRRCGSDSFSLKRVRHSSG